MNFSQKKIGIWGLGIVGEGAARFLSTRNIEVQVMDKKKLDERQKSFLKNHNISFIEQDSKKLNEFLEQNDYILPSPGIDLRPHIIHQKKWLSEVDIFGAFFKKQIIAITGTVGKTTITSVLSDILRTTGKSVLTGGNIGVPLLSLVDQQEECDLAVIELSSFQLAISQTFSPDLAIITNLYPNHLDWHGTFYEYTQAKKNIFINQQSHQKTLLPWVIHENIDLDTIKSSLAFFSLQKSDFSKDKIKDKNFYTINDHHIAQCAGDKIKYLANLQELPKISFFQNWLIIFAALDLLEVNVAASDISTVKNNYFEHRLEHVATVNGIDFYNDSKATIAQATLAAVSSFSQRPIILLIGGISKGVDRSTLIGQLPEHVKHIICFGKEAYHLHELCSKHARTAHSVATLEQAYQLALKKANQGDIILLSPGGASFDLFSNYYERGNRFKELVLQYQSTIERVGYVDTTK